MTTVAAAAVPLAVHVRVTRAAANLVEHAGIAGLAVWPEPDEIVIQVPKQAGDVPVRAAAVARLAALAGTQPAPDHRPARPAAGSPPAACSPGISCASSPKSRSHHDRPAIPAANDAAAAYQRLRSHLAYLKLPAAAEAPASSTPPESSTSTRPGRARTAAGHRSRRRRTAQARLPAAPGRPADAVDPGRLRFLRPARRRRKAHPRAGQR